MNMQPIVIDRYGGAEVLTLRQIPIPTVRPGEVLVRLRAAGVNPIDALIRGGTFPSIPLPYIVGVDLAGDVIEIGEDVEHLTEGQAVFAHLKGGNGTYCEYAALSADWVAEKPSTLSFEEAAAVPCAALTAYQALTEALNVQRGESILITGAAGGVGHFAVQFATALGLDVVGTAGAHNQAFVADLGATPLDYSAEDFVAGALRIRPQGFDHVLSTVGGETKMRADAAVRDGGSIVWMSSEEPRGPRLTRGMRGGMFYTRADHQTLQTIAGLIDDGQVGVRLEEVLALEKAVEAHRKVEAGHVRGKLSLKVRA